MKYINKTLLITGGTGSFGQATLKRFLDTDIKEIRIFSRDEKKQYDMSKKYPDPRVKYIIGDIQDYRSILKATRGVDYVFHAAAFKQVPICEFNVMECIKNNLLGAENVMEASIENGVYKVVVLSTDKAVEPVNAMGMTKALMEKVMIDRSRDSKNTILCGTRYGNVLASRGSVIPLFINQIKRGEPITITDPDMTRFWMSLDEAVELVLYACENGRNGEIFVQKSGASTMRELAFALIDILKVDHYTMKVIGSRSGEKKHEKLISKHGGLGVVEDGNYFKLWDVKQTTPYPFDYTSENTIKLSQKGLKNMLLKLDCVKEALL